MGSSIKVRVTLISWMTRQEASGMIVKIGLEIYYARKPIKVYSRYEYFQNKLISIGHLPISKKEFHQTLWLQCTRTIKLNLAIYDSHSNSFIVYICGIINAAIKKTKEQNVTLKLFLWDCFYMRISYAAPSIYVKTYFEAMYEFKM